MDTLRQHKQARDLLKDLQNAKQCHIMSIEVKRHSAESIAKIRTTFMEWQKAGEVGTNVRAVESLDCLGCKCLKFIIDHGDRLKPIESENDDNDN